MKKESPRRRARRGGGRFVPSSTVPTEYSTDTAREGHRHARLQQILHEELDALLRDEVSDPCLADARVASVELSVDYRNARARVAAPPGVLAPARLAAALERATPFLRARLAEALALKRAPLLRLVVAPPDLHPGDGTSDDEEDAR